MTAATSSVVATRPIGMSLASLASCSSVEPTRMLVSTAPGVTALTVTPLSATSRARALVNPRIGGLGRRVGHLAENPAAALRGHRRHVHDAAPAVVDHVGQEGLGDQVGAGGVDRHHLVPQLQRGVQERHRRGDAGDVGQGADGRQVACGHLRGDRLRGRRPPTPRRSRRRRSRTRERRIGCRCRRRPWPTSRRRGRARRPPSPRGRSGGRQSMPMPRSEVAPVMTAVRWMLDMCCPYSLLDEFGNQLCGSGGGLGPFVVGDVAGFQLEGEVAGVAGVGQRLEAAGEVDVAVADGQVDVARHGVADVDMRDAVGEAVDELDAGRRRRPRCG